jgi:hypothetical protein
MATLGPATGAPSNAPWEVFAPALVFAASLAVAITPLEFFLHIFCSMWLHELGHALLNWLGGIPAMPLPWVTLAGPSRSVPFVLAEWAALGFWYWSKPHYRRAVLAVFGCSILALLLPLRHLTTLVVFGGDGGALVLGAGLLLWFCFATQWHGARTPFFWVCGVMGSGSLAATLVRWVGAWRDPGQIPFGSMGDTASDASRLVEVSGWSERQLVYSYLALAAGCLVALGAAQFALWKRR